MSADRTVGTNCPCGGRAGTDSTGAETWFCTGYKGPLATYICLCACHAPEGTTR